ncbi:MAG: class C sortase [Ruminococcus sp.]
MKNKKLRRFAAILATVMLVAGIALVLFPTISNWYGKMVASDISNGFDQSVDNQKDGSYSDAKKKGLVDDEGYLADGSSDYPVYYKADIEKLKRDSIKYNEMLKSKQRDKLTNESAYEQPSLNLSKYGIFNGVYGYVEAPSIDMKLPIYLGTGRNHMNYGAAHLTYTSLPIGGEDTNCVLAGHTGYVGRIFFDNIRNLNIGDEIKVKNYWSTLEYTVTGTKVISPNEMDDIFLKEGKDMIILMTCIKNDNGEFDRYLVFCERK